MWKRRNLFPWDCGATAASPPDGCYSGGVTFDQAEFQVRCEWGLRGIKELAAVADVVVIVDVLSFTTALDIATSRGAIVFPYPLKDESATAYAASVNAELASARRGSGYSLSPVSLQSLPGGYRLVLPSPNGAALSFAVRSPADVVGHDGGAGMPGTGPHPGSADAAGRVPAPQVLAACLRNATAAARMAASLGSSVAVIPAGETWAGGELRPCIEDLLGAGAVIAALPASRSPEAELAAAAFERFRHDLVGALRSSSSGKELIERGFAADVNLAAELDVSEILPRLVHRAFAGHLSGIA
jgi:2-phosphosulfolactate phosphatase